MDFNPQTWGNIGGALLVGGYGAFRLINLLRNKKAPQQPGPHSHPDPAGCPDPGCQTKLTGEIQDLKEGFNKFKEEIFPKINDTAEGVARIEGWIEGIKNGGKW